MANRIQLTSDGFRPYNDAVNAAFGIDVDCATLVKMYSDSGHADTRYSPGEIRGCATYPNHGQSQASTDLCFSYRKAESRDSHAASQIHSADKRLFKETSAHEGSLVAAFAWYSFCHVHSPLRVTPAMAAGVTETIWPIEVLLN